MNNYCNLFRIILLIIIRFMLAVIFWLQVWSLKGNDYRKNYLNDSTTIVWINFVKNWRMKKCVHNFLDEVVVHNSHTKQKKEKNVIEKLKCTFRPLIDGR